jgi:hypothetical protein
VPLDSLYEPIILLSNKDNHLLLDCCIWILAVGMRVWPQTGLVDPESASTRKMAMKYCVLDGVIWGADHDN